MALKALKQFMQVEATGGVLLFVMALFAIFVANTPLNLIYQGILNLPIAFHFGVFQITKPILLWVNDGLMAIFFLLVGLELKREFINGELSDRTRMVLPLVSAVGGMIIPALLYIFINHAQLHTTIVRGWAIPVATDIAFALGILSLLGSRLPVSLKLFLTALAIFDDLAAIIIIAIYYTTTFSMFALIAAGICILILACLLFFRVRELTAYILVGIVLWFCVLKSGIHATVAGVILAFFIPYDSDKQKHSPLKELESRLHPWVANAVMPIFAFANAGLIFSNIHIGMFFNPLVLGISLGLFLGKQLGVFSFAWIFVKLKLAKLPAQATWIQLYGISLICGVGFTMSLFIGGLAFGENQSLQEMTKHGAIDHANLIRLGVLLGSFFSGVLGYTILRFHLPKAVEK